MSEMEPSPEPHLDENAQAGELACTLCQGEIYDAYFEVNGEASCQKCRYTVEDLRVKGSSAGRFFRASLAGSVAAVVGAGLYYAVLALTEYEFALVSILVGLMVGFAVNWGSGHRGGWLYQTLAVGLTYMAIVSTNVPFILDGWEDEIAADGISIEEGDGITAPRRKPRWSRRSQFSCRLARSLSGSPRSFCWWPPYPSSPVSRTFWVFSLLDSVSSRHGD